MFKASAFVQALITSSLLSSPPSWRISIYLLKIKPHHPVPSLKTLNAYQLRIQFKLLSKVLHNQIPTNFLSLIFDTPLPLLPPSPHGTHKVRPSCIRKTQNKWIMLLYIWMVYTYWISKILLLWMSSQPFCWKSFLIIWEPYNVSWLICIPSLRALP